MRLGFSLIFLVAALSPACSEDTDPPSDVADAGAEEVGDPDAETPDADGPPDLGTGRDAETAPDVDAGPQDPIFTGVTSIGGPRLQLTLRGTVTSTMPPLVLLPTGPMHGAEYMEASTEFLMGPNGAEGPWDRLLVYLDPRGTGNSSSGSIDDSGVSVEAQLRDLVRLMTYLEEEVGVSGPVDFLGHGYGAGLAALFAAQAPDQVSRLVLANPFPSNIAEYALWKINYESELSGSQRQALTRIEATLFSNCLSNIRRCSLDYWNIIGPEWLCEENETDVFRSMSFLNIDFRPFLNDIDRDLREDEYDWSVELGRIPASIPTTVISGPCDPIPATAPQTFTSSIAGAQHFVVEGSGHFTMTEAPEAFRRIVKRALTY